jgi:hypothetical protein
VAARRRRPLADRRARGPDRLDRARAAGSPGAAPTGWPARDLSWRSAPAFPDFRRYARDRWGLEVEEAIAAAAAARLRRRGLR